jgi:hypothetical protein
MAEDVLPFERTVPRDYRRFHPPTDTLSPWKALGKLALIILIIVALLWRHF